MFLSVNYLIVEEVIKAYSSDVWKKMGDCVDFSFNLGVISIFIRLNDTVLLSNHHMEQDGFSDKSEREAHEDWDAAVNENGGRLTEESDMDQSDEPSPGPQSTAYVEQNTEEMAEVKGMSLRT